MTRLTWTDLEAIYAVTNFEADGNGRLTINNEQVRDTLLLIDEDTHAMDDAGMAILTDRSELQLGREAQVHFSAPRTSLGRFVRTFSNLIAGPKARVEEPNEYFVVEGRITRHTCPAAEIQIKYRLIISLVNLLEKSAIFLDPIHQVLVFVRDGRIEIPIDYDVTDLESIDTEQVERFIGIFADQIHRDQKLTILAEAVVDLVAGLPSRERFRQIIREIKDLGEKVAAGYRLFTSSFTYSKIRREIESAQADFITRIHKTFVDLQGQILGIPIATIVVASQLKPAKSCGIEFWTNIAIVAGAWIFVIFLLASIVNQWFTLSAVSSEFSRQQERLVNDFAELRTDFAHVFVELNRRACWHRVVFVSVGAIGIVGATFATWAATKLIGVEFATCI
ncbi:hypothetical protein V6768_23935 [Tistrella mobilis]